MPCRDRRQPNRETTVVLKKILAYRTLLFLLILLNSGAFFLTDDKKAGIPYLRELFTLGIIAVTVLLFFTWRWVYQSRTSLWIVVMGLTLPLLSALFAKLNFGQPIPYGLLEERRFFLYLVFFPTLYLLIRAAPTQEQLTRYFMYSGVICALYGFAYHFNVIPDNADFDFHRDPVDWGDNPLRPGRYRIGAGYVGLCAFILMYSMRDRVTVARLSLLLFFTAYLWMVLQTRSTMLIWALAGLWIFRNRFDSLFKLALLGSVMLAASYVAFPEFYHLQYAKFLALFDEAVRSEGVRDNTIATILRAIRENDYFGMGALSLQWNGGFATVYDRHFYLADVGLFGLYYRFGFLTLPIAVLFYSMLFWLLIRCREKSYLLAALQLKLVFMAFNFVLSNGIFFGGDDIGMAAALFLYYARVGARAPAEPAQAAPVGYGALRQQPG